MKGKVKMSKTRNRRPITDAEVENEIAVLRDDPDVKLSQLERQLKMRYLYDLRCLKKHGKELRDAGFDEDTLRELYNNEEV